MSRFGGRIASLAATLLISASAMGQESPDSQPIAAVSGGTVLSFEPKVWGQAISLTVSGPGVRFRHVFELSEVPYFEPYTQDGLVLEDGLYRFGLRTIPNERDSLDGESSYGGEPLLHQTGSFRMSDGMIITHPEVQL